MILRCLIALAAPIVIAVLAPQIGFALIAADAALRIALGGTP